MNLKKTLKEVSSKDSKKLGKDITMKSYEFIKDNSLKIKDFMIEGIIENYERHLLENYRYNKYYSNFNSYEDLSFFGLSLKEYKTLFESKTNGLDNTEFKLNKKYYNYSLVSSKVLEIFNKKIKKDNEKCFSLLGDLIKSINNDFYIISKDHSDSINEEDIYKYVKGIKNGLSFAMQIYSEDLLREQFKEYYKELKEVEPSFSFRNDKFKKEYYNRDNLEEILKKERYNKLYKKIYQNQFYKLIILDKEFQNNINKLIK